MPNSDLPENTQETKQKDIQPKIERIVDGGIELYKALLESQKVITPVEKDAKNDYAKYE